ncbi:MAG: hypothetical protein HYS87_01570 [Candidatus Colwellbacteria bacterium]|nr:hypothetical protein [Candidatus Colwellbacteria bacterium]
MFLKKLFNSFSRLEKIILIGAIAVFVLSGSVKAAIYVVSEGELLPERGGRFVEGVVGQPVFINPIIPTSRVDRDIAELVFSSAKDLADSIKMEEDGKVWTLRLKEGVLWHDGARVTSDDILFSLEVLQDVEARSPYFASFQGVAAERISELEIKFALQSPYVFFGEENLKLLGVIPKHIFGDIPVQNYKLSALGLRPVGSGPYKVAGLQQDSRGVISQMELVAHDKGVEAPNITNFVFKFFKSDEELVQNYNRGAIDGFGLSIAHGQDLSEGGDIKIRRVVEPIRSLRHYAIFINNSLEIDALEDGDVRRALSSTVDRDRIIKEVFGGEAAPIYGPTTFVASDTEEVDLSVLEGLEFNITVPDEDFLVKTVEIIEENWEAYGAQVNLLVLPLKDIQEVTLKTTNYEMLVFGNAVGESYDLFAFWHSLKRFYPDQNLSQYQSKKIDELLELYRSEPDKEARHEMLSEIGDQIAADYPAIFLYVPNYMYVHAPRLKGFDSNFTINSPPDRFGAVGEWYVKTRREF